MTTSPSLPATQPAPLDIGQLIADYYTAVRSLDIELWGSKFAEAATMEDPVGSPPAHGREEAKQRYSVAASSFSELNMVPDDIFISPATNEAAVRWSVTLHFRGGDKIVSDIHGISLFKFDQTGLIESFRAFWDQAALAGAMQYFQG